jgi:hypothetical protein
MAHMAFSGHDSEQPVNPSDVRLVINSVPAFIHTAMPDGYLERTVPAEPVGEGDSLKLRLRRKSRSELARKQKPTDLASYGYP